MSARTTSHQAVIALACALAGCPLAPDEDTTMQGGAGAAAAEVAKAIAKAEDTYPAPPSTKQLCALQFGATTFDAAKKLFGPPAEESMDKTQAGLSYRYRGSVSMILSFDWSDGTPGVGTILTGIGGDPEDLITGYVLAEASITGQPYPGCWPHEEP